MFQAFVDFLHSNNLITHRLVSEGEKISDDLKIYRSDLTPLGYEVMKNGFHKWLKEVSSGNVLPTDCSILENELQSIL